MNQPVKSTAKLALAGLCALLAACASFTAPSTPPSATVSITGATAAQLGMAGAGGKGKLTYQGKVHSFNLAGGGIGGLGGARVVATGQVYNLTKLADFAGPYHGTTSGFTVKEGQMTAKMTNDKGVTVYVTGKREGFSTNFGLKVIQITLLD